MQDTENSNFNLSALGMARDYLTGKYYAEVEKVLTMAPETAAPEYPGTDQILALAERFQSFILLGK